MKLLPASDSTLTANLELANLLTQISSRLPGVIYQYKLRPDGSSCFPYASEAIREIYRVTPEQVKTDATPVLAVIHPEDYAGVVASIQTSADTLEPWLFEYRVKFGEDSVRWLCGNALPSKEADGSVLWTGFITDVTEYKRIEIALQLESQKNTAFLRNASDGVTIMDQDGYLLEFSDSFCTLLGYTREELLGMHVSEWDVGVPKSELMHLVKGQFQKQVRALFETRHRRKDGSVYDAEISGFPIELNDKWVLFNSTRDITRRKDAAEQMRLLLAEQRAIIDSDLLGIVKAKDRIIRWANPTFEKMLGYADGELINAPTRQLFVDTRAYQALGDQAYPLLAAGKVYRAEIEYTCKDGRHIWTDVRGVSLRNESGESLWTFVDITERKKIEQLESYRSKVLELLATAAPVADVLTAIVTGIESIEPTMLCSILILDAAGKHLHVGAAPSLPDFYNALVDGVEIGPEVGSCGAVAYTGKRVIAADINTHPYWAPYKHIAMQAKLGSCWSEPILSTTQKVLGTFAIYHHEAEEPTAKDIQIIETAAKLAAIAIEQKLTREELERHQNQLEELVKNRTLDLQTAHAQLLDTQFAMEVAGIGIRWIDTETGEVVYSNKYAAEMLGYSVEEMLSMRVNDFDPNFPAEKLQQIISTIRQNGSGQIETLNLTKDGRAVPVEISLYYLPPRADTPSRLIGFITDISSRKQTESVLRHAKLAADAASQAKSNFLANMSHEIRTPMNAIMGMTYLLLKKGNLNSEQVDKLQKISSASDHLLAIINDVLDLTKIEAGKLTLEQLEFNPTSMLANALSLISDRASAKGLNLRIEPSLLPATLIGDSTRLQQMLLNYLSNAVKFTEQGEISLQASVLAESQADILLKFAVQDSGIGISAEQKTRLFNIFEQADNTTTRKFGGTGLGLAINSRLAQLMAGEVGVESQLKVGSYFWFTARLKKVVAKPLPVAAVSNPLSESFEAKIRQHHTGKRLLVTEDIEINRMVVEEILAETGLQIDFAEDGLLALTKLQLTQFDIILMDVQMPNMDGLAATRAIRQFPGYAATPIIAMTGNAFNEDRQICLAAGMTDFLAKPVRARDLLETLLRWL